MDVARLERAAEEVSWLVKRGYPTPAVSDFVATHRELDDSERALLRDNARLDANYRHHIAREMDAEDVRKRTLVVDVSSAVATVSAALAGRGLLESSAGVHLDPGWSRDEPGDLGGLTRLASVFDELRPAKVRFVVDPAHAAAVEDAARSLGKRKWKHEVASSDDVPKALAGNAFVVSSDPEVLDACATWVNAVSLAIEGLDGPRWRLSP
jgi:hypothetical protein